MSEEKLKPCDHPGCMNHVTHPCEGCGRRWGGEEKVVELALKIRTALCDPKAPWYGSDLVEWVDDYMNDCNSLKRERDEALAKLEKVRVATAEALNQLESCACGDSARASEEFSAGNVVKGEWYHGKVNGIRLCIAAVTDYIDTEKQPTTQDPTAHATPEVCKLCKKLMPCGCGDLVDEGREDSCLGCRGGSIYHTCTEKRGLETGEKGCR